jgi:hypothetical protein
MSSSKTLENSQCMQHNMYMDLCKQKIKLYVLLGTTNMLE